LSTAEVWGVQAGYHDISGEWHPAQQSTVDSILDAMGADATPPPEPVMWVIRVDRPLPSLPAGRLLLEEGGELGLAGGVPPELPLGYHQLITDSEPPRPVAVSPGGVPLPERDMWGFAVQLYATRSARSWGMGDLADLARLGRWSAGLGAGMVVVNPLHAVSPTIPQQPSPYFPGSRCFFNPIYLAVDEIDGGRTATPPSATALNADRLIDRNEVWRLKSAALSGIYSSFAGDADFEAFVEDRGEPLRNFATYCALAESLGATWDEWPAELRSPDTSQAQNFGSSRAGATRVRYHMWLQWLMDQQLTRAGRELGVVQDLAVGVDPHGADTWIWQDTFARGMTFGAPPDEFNTRGQNWALAPFDPWKLRSIGYEPWIHGLRQVLRHSHGLRVDHVMGLFRLYWIPEACSAAEGAYVRYPYEDLLNLMALEAHRAGAFIAGEDLGTVEDEVRRECRERQVLTYRLWWFEPEQPDTWPRSALAAVSTHDLPTVAGVLSGSDLEAQRRLGMEPNEEASAGLRRKLLEETGSDDQTPVVDVITRVYADLGRAPCVALAASLEDALAVEERPNMPGTIDEWPNWRLALPIPLEEIERVPLAAEIASLLSRET
jgi:4-alpha-glucanotransferase